MLLSLQKMSLHNMKKETTEVLNEKTEELEQPDYTRIFHDEARALAQDVIEKFAEKKDVLISDVLEKDTEKNKAQEEINVDFGLSVIKILSDSKLPADYASMVFDKIIDEITGLKQFVTGTIASHEMEITSRFYGKKNYKGKFRKEEATVGDIILKLQEIREQTGGELNDYFDM